MPRYPHHKNAKAPDEYPFAIVLLFLPFLLFVLVLKAAMPLLFHEQPKSVNNKEASVHLAKGSVIRIDIDFGNKRRSFEGNAAEGLTLADALLDIASLTNMKLEISNGLVKMLGNLTSNRTRQWHAYRNGSEIDARPLSIILSPHDRILLRYQ